MPSKWAMDEAENQLASDVISQWPKAGWCKKCKMPVGAWMIDLSRAKTQFAAALDATYARALEDATTTVDKYKRDASFDDSGVGALEHNSNQANIAAAIRALKDQE